jgi:hypothetical protein
MKADFFFNTTARGLKFTKFCQFDIVRERTVADFLLEDKD